MTRTAVRGLKRETSTSSLLIIDPLAGAPPASTQAPSPTEAALHATPADRKRAHREDDAQYPIRAPDREYAPPAPVFPGAAAGRTTSVVQGPAFSSAACACVVA